MGLIRQIAEWIVHGHVISWRRYRPPAMIDTHARLARIRKIMERTVCTQGIDKGVILLSDHAPTHFEMVDGKKMCVYNHEYFSPLGDALIEVWELTRANPEK